MNAISFLRTLLVAGLILGAAHAEEIELMAKETGIEVGTPLEIGDGRFTISAPVLVNKDIYQPIRPTVEVVNDKTLSLTFPNKAAIKVVLERTRATVSYSGIPPEATAIAFGMKIARDAYQGSQFAIDGRAPEAFPEEDERRILFEGKTDSLSLRDPASRAVAIRSPKLKVRIDNKSSEGWSQYASSWLYLLEDHPNESSFTIDFSSAAQPQ